MYHSNVSGRSSELRALLIASFIRRISFVNNGWRELKETPSSDWKIPCQEVIFCREQKEITRVNVGRNAKRHCHAGIKVAVADERAQFSFDVVFSEVDEFQRKQQGVVFCWLIHSCIRLVEKRTKVVLSVEQRSTAISLKKVQSTTQRFQMKNR
ncbi:hypothetical protein T06_14090 [Trichinella sp. T6]|nr:hypothetical protein T06_14090 [Trichinella sp. T6]